MALAGDRPGDYRKRAILALESMPASALGKGKMVSQVVAIFLLLFSLHYPELKAPALAALWVVVVLAVVSGLDYFRMFFLETGRPAPRPVPPVAAEFPERAPAVKAGREA